ncbi:MAG: hypothetical protein RR806_05035 [Oscillospiraceae bacterium]
MDKLNTQLIKTFEDKLDNSYSVYKNEMLQRDKLTIFNSAHQIHFFECLVNYLQQYVWDDSAEHKCRLELLNKQQNILYPLWNTYTETEWLGYTSWEEIDDLMGEFYRLNNIE